MGLRDTTMKILMVSDNYRNNSLQIASTILFINDTGTPEKNIPPLGDVNEGETVSTCVALSFSSSVSTSTEVSTISAITLNSAFPLAYTSVISTIGSQHTAEKE